MESKTPRPKNTLLCNTKSNRIMAQNEENF